MEIIICKQCKSTFNKRRDLSKKRIRQNIFCSLPCYFKSKIGIKHNHKTSNGYIPRNKGKKIPEQSGENHWAWKKDRTLLKDDRKDRGGQLHREWSLTVKNRDKWTCRIADINCDGRIESHHILGWTKYPELRYEVNNGITLCHFHHPRKRNDEMRLSPYFQELVKVN